MAAKEKKGQLRWIELGRIDLRHAHADDHLPQVLALAGADTVEEAILILEHHLGFKEGLDIVYLACPLGTIAAHREYLTHIVEKRVDARERYVQLAINTMADPFEIWHVEYDDGSFRHAYIGLFEGKTQMLVVVTHHNGQLLWNFMHSEHKSLNRHRHGALVYERPKKTKGESEDSPEAVSA
jgi:hypothetical protein